MKHVTFFILLVFLTQLSYSQTMDVHKNDQTTISFQLSQIDSITFSPLSSITFTGRQIRGIAYESGLLWATHGPPDSGNVVKIAKIDPSNGQILLQSNDLLWNGRGITVGAGALWVSDALADIVHKVDPTTLNEISSFPTPGSEPNGIAFDGSSLWLTDPWFQNIYQLDTSGTVISNFSIPNEFRTALEWEGAGMWTKTDTNKVSFYTTSGSITSTRTLTVLPSGNTFFDIAIGGGKVFISSGDKIYIQDWIP